MVKCGFQLAYLKQSDIKWAKIYQGNLNKGTAGVKLLIAEKVDFKEVNQNGEMLSFDIERVWFIIKIKFKFQHASFNTGQMNIEKIIEIW